MAGDKRDVGNPLPPPPARLPAHRQPNRLEPDHSLHRRLEAPRPDPATTYHNFYRLNADGRCIVVDNPTEMASLGAAKAHDRRQAMETSRREPRPAGRPRLSAPCFAHGITQSRPTPSGRPLPARQG